MPIPWFGGLSGERHALIAKRLVAANPRGRSLALAVRLRVADADAARIRATCASACHADVMRATVVLGVQGRLVVPAEARRELGLAAGDELVLHTEDGRLVLERREDAGSRLRGMHASSATRGSVGELLTERRQAAASE